MVRTTGWTTPWLDPRLDHRLDHRLDPLLWLDHRWRWDTPHRTTGWRLVGRWWDTGRTSTGWTTGWTHHNGWTTGWTPHSVHRVGGPGGPRTTGGPIHVILDHVPRNPVRSSHPLDFLPHPTEHVFSVLIPRERHGHAPSSALSS